jgi:hypothetical protein
MQNAMQFRVTTYSWEINRPRLESLILNRLRELKGIEIGLDRQYAGLKFASSKARAAFLQGLEDLEKRALWLEGLIDALDAGAERGRPQLNLV